MLRVVAVREVIALKKRPVVILGAGSDIGLAVARRFAAEGYPIQLAARRPNELEPEKSDISLRHNVEVSLHRFDALDSASHDSFVVQLPELPEIAVCAVGLIGNQTDSERNLECACEVMRSNYEGPASILAVLANHFEKRGSGTLIGISSVAGDRGRARNYVYGSAKSGFTAFLSGLRSRLANHGVDVITVKPGFVDTRMIEGTKTPKILTARPEEVGEAVYRAVRESRDIIYVRRIWWAIMLVIRAIPEAIFKRLQI